MPIISIKSSKRPLLSRGCVITLLLFVNSALATCELPFVLVTELSEPISYRSEW